MSCGNIFIYLFNEGEKKKKKTDAYLCLSFFNPPHFTLFNQMKWLELWQLFWTTEWMRMVATYGKGTRKDWTSDCINTTTVLDFIKRKKSLFCLGMVIWRWFCNLHLDLILINTCINSGDVFRKKNILKITQVNRENRGLEEKESL